MRAASQGLTRTGWLFGLLGVLALAVLALYLFNPTGTATLDPRARVVGYVPYRVPGASMVPTVQPGELVLVSAWAYRRAAPRRGDVIVFQAPHQPGVDYVKRVAGAGGDTVEIRDGVLRVNGREVPEPWLDAAALQLPQSREFGPIRLDEQQLFVLGDKRDNSEDSRFWGPVARAAVVGRVERIWFSHDPERIGPVH